MPQEIELPFKLAKPAIGIIRGDRIELLVRFYLLEKPTYLNKIQKNARIESVDHWR